MPRPNKNNDKNSGNPHNTPPGQAQKEDKPSVSPEKPVVELIDSDKQKILKAVEKHGKKPNFFKKLFQRSDTFVLLINHGTHRICLPLRKRNVKYVNIDEREELCGAATCGGANNVIDYTIDANNKQLIINADVKTNLTILVITVR